MTGIVTTLKGTSYLIETRMVPTDRIVSEFINCKVIHAAEVIKTGGTI